MSVDADVAIVGFGPGGEALASLLGQAGHRVVVFEKSAVPYGLPRMSTLDGETARLMQHTANPDEALEGSIPQPGAIFYGANGEIATTADWGFKLCGHPYRLSLHQPNIEKAMEARIRECPTVTIHWGYEVTGLDDTGDEIRITAAPSKRAGVTNEGAAVAISATYVIGMDGASSFVRESLGIPIEVVQNHEDRWVLTDFDIVDPELQPPTTTVHLDPNGPWFWGPNGANRCRTDVRVMDPTATNDDLLEHEKAYEFLERKLGINREQVSITRRVVYKFRSQYAKTFRKGRVFIGGDAAHTMTPGIGQGSCSAMRDASNLAWKLDLILTGRATEALLDSYEPERLSHVLPLIHGSVIAWERAIENDPVKVAERDAFLRSSPSPEPPVPGLMQGILHKSGDELAAGPTGALSPQGRVRLAGQEGLLDSLIGSGFQLISSSPLHTALSDAQVEVLERLGVHVLVLGEGPDDLQDLDGTYSEFFAANEVTALLARPDFFLFGVAAGPDETKALVEDLLSQLSLTS
ncbi:FAD-dependent monooxygenase [Angustibacter luteus]|uniref:FAD-dependent monooxygenase n=1 Tax=Angustibacter luteus TaxID=658456 RepID=A0ABW1JEL9_9ACTN